MTFGRISKTLFLVAAAFLVAGFLNSFSSSKPKQLAGWNAHNPGGTKPIDHSAWNGILKKYVRGGKNGVNRFTYGKVSGADRKALKAYIAKMGKVNVAKKSRKVQLAYWINLYNAATVDVVLDHYPVKSIRDIDISGAFSNGPWKKKFIKVRGKSLSLDNIEHGILRPIWRDARIHYGVNCASIGCPNLQRVAYSGKTVDKLLTKGARDYVNSSRGLSIKNGKVTVSKIYEWFAYDFGNSEKGVIKHLLKYAGPKKAAALEKAGRIHKTRYDWSINK
ncbi:MAG: DUF547 domain-containing protein [Hyphomicrobiales bacterium]